jgi:hypothetical protein
MEQVCRFRSRGGSYVFAHQALLFTKSLPGHRRSSGGIGKIVGNLADEPSGETERATPGGRISHLLPLSPS